MRSGTPAPVTCSGCKLTIAAGPTISMVSPRSVSRGVATVLTVTGSHFKTGMVMRLSGAKVTYSATTLDSATQAHVTVTIDPGQTAGTRSVEVQNKDKGSAWLTNAVTVT